jgi:hypothetical protein
MCDHDRMHFAQAIRDLPPAEAPVAKELRQRVILAGGTALRSGLLLRLGHA